MLINLFAIHAFGQGNHSLTQYFQVPNLLNPGFTGLQDYTDLKIASQQQWTAFDEAPKSYLFSISAPVYFTDDKEALFDTVRGYKPVMRGGMGAFVIQKNMGGFKDLETGLSYAMHVPITSKYRLSMGMTASYSRVKADLDKFIVRDEDDTFYKSIVSSDGSLQYLLLDAGLLLSSERFTVGYSALRLSSSRFGINKEVDSKDKLNIRHQAIVTYNFMPDINWEVIPSLLFRYERFVGSTAGINVKARYRSQFWGGLGLNTGDSFSGLVGFTFKNNFHLSYSYAMSLNEVQNYSMSTHEVVIGISIFNRSNQKIVLW